MPTHLVRLGVTINAIEDTTNMTPIIILKNHDYEIEKLFQSFGISKFVYLDDINLNQLPKNHNLHIHYALIVLVQHYI